MILTLRTVTSITVEFTSFLNNGIDNEMDSLINPASETYGEKGYDERREVK